MFRSHYSLFLLVGLNESKLTGQCSAFSLLTSSGNREFNFTRMIVYSAKITFEKYKNHASTGFCVTSTLRSFAELAMQHVFRTSGGKIESGTR